MLGLTAAAVSWLADHHGVATTRQMLDAGVTRTAIGRLLDAGVVRRPTRGVYVLEGSPSTLLQRCAVLCATYPTGFVTGPTAGMLAELRRMPPSASLHFSLRHGINPLPEYGARFRQTTSLRPSDRHSRTDGVVVASSARLAFDLAADLRQLDHRSVVEQLLDRRAVTREELAAMGARLCHPARPGSTTFARTVATLGRGRAQGSHEEVVLFDALRARGVPVEPQVPVRVADGVIHLDLGVAAARWGVELDLHPEHRTIEGHRRDAARRRATNDRDWQVELVAELDMHDSHALADRLAVSYSRRVRRLAASDRSTGREPVRRPVLGQR